jgi:hypothetical protein
VLDSSIPALQAATYIGMLEFILHNAMLRRQRVPLLAPEF